MSLIYEYFLARNYQRMLELLTALINSKNQYYRQNDNFYLYLFSMIMDLPASYKSQLENFIFEDIKVLSIDTRYQNIEIQNKTRLMAFQDSFVLAHNILFSDEQDLTKIQSILTPRLLNAVSDTEIESENTILRMAQEKKWDDVFTYLVQKQNRPEFSIKFSSYIQQFYIALSKNEFKIARIYLEIIDQGSQMEEKSTSILELYQILNLAETCYNRENIPSKKLSTEIAGKQYIK